jgi:hypothetical protein
MLNMCLRKELVDKNILICKVKSCPCALLIKHYIMMMYGEDPCMQDEVVEERGNLHEGLHNLYCLSVLIMVLKKNEVLRP